eukprot:6477606-Amphidinium_carterae.1
MKSCDRVHALKEELKTFHVELEKRSSHLPCLFGDIKGFFKPKVLSLLEKCKEQQSPLAYLEMLGTGWRKNHFERSNCVPLFGAKSASTGELVREKSPMRTNAWCYTHKRECRLGAARLHVAGTPCTDFSAMGQRTL